MPNPEVVALRAEYASLVLVADGLLSVIRAGAACNTLTMARMADDARAAARKVAAAIERLCQGVRAFLGRLGAAVAAFLRVDVILKAVAS
jgi:hypothetical protein